MGALHEDSPPPDLFPNVSYFEIEPIKETTQRDQILRVIYAHHKNYGKKPESIIIGGNFLFRFWQEVLGAEPYRDPTMLQEFSGVKLIFAPGDILRSTLTREQVQNHLYNTRRPA